MSAAELTALVLANTPEFSASWQSIDESLLTAGDVTVELEYSSLNYKDALAITNRAPIVRRWPMVAGVDGAGKVVASASDRWQIGDEVLITGFGIGESHTGCLAQRARLESEWLVRKPEQFSTRQAMALGTAGVTAMLFIMTLERHHVVPGDGEVLVTGATGGVGSLAILLLHALGYRIAASTGKRSEASYLQALGADSIIDREELGRAVGLMQEERWAAVLDVAGSHTLANACAQTRHGGVVAACGMAQGYDFPASVLPFILRGITLCGIDSVMASLPLREQAWTRLARDVDLAKLDALTRKVRRPDVIAEAALMVGGHARGRLVVPLQD